jgi:hypothetical protein
MASAVEGNPALVAGLLSGLERNEPRVKNGCSKVLRVLAETYPETLLPHWDFIARLIESDNSFLRWDAIRVLACLAAVDPERRFDGIFRKYFQPVPGPVLITAANTVGAARIAGARPDPAERIATEVLKVEHGSYQTAECRNIAIGQAVLSLDRFFPNLRRKRRVVEFVRRQLANSRPATRKKAERFLAKSSVEPRGFRDAQTPQLGQW